MREVMKRPERPVRLVFEQVPRSPRVEVVMEVFVQIEQGDDHAVFVRESVVAWVAMML